MNVCTMIVLILMNTKETCYEKATNFLESDGAVILSGWRLFSNPGGQP
jgi:hypothetical protein